MGIIIRDYPYYQFSNGRSGPAFNVAISKPGHEGRMMVLALIDSGADITALPKENIEELEQFLEEELTMSTVQMIDSEGQVIELKTYNILVILENEFPYLEDGMLPWDKRSFGDEDMWVGRDIQRKLKITLNGPNQTFTIEDPSHC